ncbi:efflux RND transporter periplasmic adaptor subunit [Legionella sp. W05-934-2]|uniref:efflux RND transporter periplasmic adaptor subunit n=1 Tax=Legionella sp. W05-934-2 TaxID=1198649 RepID=UPI003461E938
MKNQITLNKVIPFVFILLTILLVTGIILTSGSKPSGKITEKIWPVQSIAIQKSNTSPEIILYGQVESPKTTTITSSLQTTVKTVYVKEGNIVKKDDMLVMLDPEEFEHIVHEKQMAIEEINSQIQMEMVENDLDIKSEKYLNRLVNTNETMMKRLETLEVRKLEAQSNVDEALNKLLSQQIMLVQKNIEIKTHTLRLNRLKAKKMQQEHQYQQAKLDLADATLTSPFHGRIIEVFVSPGDGIGYGSKIVSLYDLNDVEIRAQLPYKYLAVTTKAMEDTSSFKAKIMSPLDLHLSVLRTGASLKQGSSTIDIFFKIPAKHSLLFPLNQTVKVYLQLPVLNDVYVIPSTSLYGESRIYLIKNNRLKSVHVQVLGEKYIKGELFYLIRQTDLPDKFNLLSSKLPNARDGLMVTTNERK